MTPEQFENTVNFILGCQVRTDETLERITKKNEETSILVHQNSEDIRELKTEIRELKDACRDLLDASINQSKRLSRLEDR